MRFDRANLALGLGCVALALLVALIWVPMDSTTGLIEKVRRRVTIGDALAPTLAAGFLLLGGMLVTLAERAETARRISLKNLAFLLMLIVILAVAFTLMRWLGPVLAGALTENGYRPLRDTVPWKYIGFLVGGTAMVAGLTALAERRMTWRGVLIGLAATLALIAVYDLPFDDLLLPPNGDV